MMIPAEESHDTNNTMTRLTDTNTDTDTDTDTDTITRRDANQRQHMVVGPVSFVPRQ